MYGLPGVLNPLYGFWTMCTSVVQVSGMGVGTGATVGVSMLSPYGPAGGASPVTRCSGGGGGPRVAAEIRARVVARLTGLRAVGQLRAEHVRLAATGLGVSERTVYRWLRTRPSFTNPLGGDGDAGGPAEGRGFRLGRADWEAFEDFGGNVSAVFRARCAVLAGRDEVLGLPIAEHLRAGWRGAPAVGLRTLQGAFRAAMTPAERAYWCQGPGARRDRRVYGQRVSAHRNALWQVDHTNLDVVVLPPHGPAQRPWLTSFLDHRHRVVMGWVIALRPDAGVVNAALRSAMVADADDGGYGGVPVVIEHDRAWEFGANALRAACATLQIELRPRPPRSPRAGGVVERWHETIDQLLLCQLPGFTGAGDVAGRLCGPVRDDRSWREHAAELSADGGEATALTLRALVALFARFVVAYNHEHVPEGLAGLSPLQSWRADPAPLHEVDPDQVRDLLLEVKDSVAVTSKGIRFDNLHYVPVDLPLSGMSGQRVQIRYAPHDRRFIEVYQQGRHLGTAYPADALTPQQQETRRRAWAEEGRRRGARMRKANQRARRRVAPLNATAGEPVDTLPDALTAPHAPRTRLPGSTSLLGLRDPLALLGDPAAGADSAPAGDELPDESGRGGQEDSRDA